MGQNDRDRALVHTRVTSTTRTAQTRRGSVPPHLVSNSPAGRRIASTQHPAPSTTRRISEWAGVQGTASCRLAALKHGEPWSGLDHALSGSPL